MNNDDLKETWTYFILIFINWKLIKFPHHKFPVLIYHHFNISRCQKNDVLNIDDTWYLFYLFIHTFFTASLIDCQLKTNNAEIICKFNAHMATFVTIIQVCLNKIKYAGNSVGSKKKITGN
jgi:hypothetical protein